MHAWVYCMLCRSNSKVSDEGDECEGPNTLPPQEPSAGVFYMTPNLLNHLKKDTDSYITFINYMESDAPDCRG